MRNGIQLSAGQVTLGLIVSVTTSLFIDQWGRRPLFLASTTLMVLMYMGCMYSVHYLLSHLCPCVLYWLLLTISSFRQGLSWHPNTNERRTQGILGTHRLPSSGYSVSAIK